MQEGEGEGGEAPNNFKGGNIPFAPRPSHNPPTFSLNFYVKQKKADHMIIYVPFISLEGIGISILFNSILAFAILSNFKMTIVSIWH